MNLKLKTSQENLWSGEFGDKYTARNLSPALFTSSVALFTRILKSTQGVKSVMEFGANVGINIQALKPLLPQAEFSALEINRTAVAKFKKIENLKVYHQSVLDYKPDYKRDFVFTRCLLIHINPGVLPDVYDTIYKSARKYICLAEYYNPSPMTIEYRGQSEVLFKRDFAGEMLDRHKRLRLVDYGFIYHRDPNFPQDDVSWFLMEVC